MVTWRIWRWAYVAEWYGFRHCLEGYRWGVIRGRRGGCAYLGPVKLVWGPA